MGCDFIVGFDLRFDKQIFPFLHIKRRDESESDKEEDHKLNAI